MGGPHRKEVRLRQLDGQLYLSNNPGTRDWAANLFANPEFTYHLKQSVQRDLRVRATLVRDVDEKRALLTRILEKEGRAGYGGGARRGQPPLPYRGARLGGG